MSFDVDWVDAFSDRAFGGNGCAVVHGGAVLDEATSLAFVRETSLVECTFTGPSDVADLRVRYFLASREIPFAGHPTVATVAALRARGMVSDGDLTLETGAGVIPIRVEDGQVTMRQNAPVFGQKVSAETVAGIYGLPQSAILGRPQMVSTGLPFCVALLKDRDAIQAARLHDHDKLQVFQAGLGVEGQDAVEPYLITMDGAPDGATTFARLLLGPPNPPEDPFTGSATGAAAAYLWAHGWLETPNYTAAQGDDMGRPGRANVEVLGPRDAIDGVMVSGRAHVLMQGTLHL